MVPAPDGGNNLVGVLGPEEGAWVGVGLSEEALDGGLKRDEGVEHAPLQALLGQLGEEPLDRVDP